MTYNPYDFANPVSDADLFVGRGSELSDIRYYLEHASSAPRPINLALLGPRASGKTSLLNMIELEAEKRKQCPVRINLDEDDARSQLTFFFKVFDSIFSEACKRGAFGGKEGKTFEVYLDLVNSYLVPEEKTFCPFIFPIQYAKAMSIGNQNALLSDTNYRQDLAAIRAELNQPIVLMFDEGNVLAKSRSLLEKLRNIFMNTPGFMLILTGTPELFPVIDEVFSPIVRQFKKINVVNFTDEDETKDCIRKPLAKTSVNPDELFDFDDVDQIREIHALSGGRPYEIQLLCFFMFKRVQVRRAKRMSLDLIVLEEVRKELETTQDIYTRPILTAVRGLEKKPLSALSLFCAFQGLSSLEQVWATEFTFKGCERWTADELEKGLMLLEEVGILEHKNELIQFKGDDFDRIYTKYFAREEGVSINFGPYPVQIYWMLRLRGLLANQARAVLIPGAFDDVSKIAEQLSSPESTDVFVESSGTAEWLYKLMLSHTNATELTVFFMTITFRWLTLNVVVHQTEQAPPDAFETASQRLGQFASRAQQVGGSIQIERETMSVAPTELLASKVEHSANAELRGEFAIDHSLFMISKYLVDSKDEEAAFHASLSLRYDPQPDWSTSNNVAYVLMSVGRLSEAQKLFERAAEIAATPYEESLAIYNLAVLEAKLGNATRALDLVRRAIELGRSLDERRRSTSCLFAAKTLDGDLVFEEYRKDVDLLEVAVETENGLAIYLEGNKESIH